MTYHPRRLPSGIGQVDFSRLSKSATSSIASSIGRTAPKVPSGSPSLRTSRNFIVPDSTGFDLAPRSVKDDVTIQLPAYCGALPDLLEGVKFPTAGSKLQQGKLYVAVWPLLRKLNASQQQTVEQTFLRYMNPVAADYPVPMTTPCDLGARKADACHCRDRKNPARWVPHESGHVKDSWDVQKCRNNTEKLKARSWISFYNQLWPWFELPWGYREINGEPVFVMTIALNPDPRIELYREDGTLESGNLKSKRYPEVGRQRVYNWAGAMLKRGISSVGMRSTDVTPGLMLEINKWDATALSQQVDQIASWTNRLSDAEKKNSEEVTPEFVERSLTWDRERYKKGVRKSSGNSKHPDIAYMQLIHKAIDQATAYGRDAVQTVWSILASLFAFVFISAGTDKYARSLNATMRTRIMKLQTGTALVMQSGAIAAQTVANAEPLVDSPDPLSAYKAIKVMRDDLQEGIMRIGLAQTELPQAPQHMAELFEGVSRSGIEIKNGLTRTLANLKSKLSPTAAGVRQRFECKLYAKAKSEQQKWPRKLLDNVEPFQQAIQAYASVHPQSQTAVQNFQAAIERLNYIESQLNLPWWQKDLGPLPMWGWGAIGVTTFVGGAVYLRKKRRKVAPKKNRRRSSRRVRSNRSSRESVADAVYRIAKANKNRDQATATAIRKEFGDDAMSAARTGEIAAQGGAEVRFWKDIQVLLELGYNPRRRRRRRRTSRVRA